MIRGKQLSFAKGIFDRNFFAEVSPIQDHRKGE